MRGYEQQASPRESRIQTTCLSVIVGDAAQQQGNAQQAAAYLKKAVQLAPKDSRLHYSLSRAYRRLNRPAEAAKETALYQKLKAAEQPTKGDDSGGGMQP